MEKVVSSISKLGMGGTCYSGSKTPQGYQNILKNTPRDSLTADLLGLTQVKVVLINYTCIQYIYTVYIIRIHVMYV